MLVLGGDVAIRELLSRLRCEDFEILLLDDRNGVSTGPGAVLEELHGFIGGFDVTLSSDGGQSVERVGYVIAAPPAENTPKYADYGLSRSEKVISISELEAMLENPSALFKSAADWRHVVFLCGLEGESDPNTFERVFDAIEKLRSVISGSAVHLYQASKGGRGRAGKTIQAGPGRRSAVFQIRRRRTDL